MPAKIIDGKSISTQIKDEIKKEIDGLIADGKNAPSLAVIIVGSNPASQVYVRNKKMACKYTGIQSFSYELSEGTTEDELIQLIEKLNNDININGILVQLPLPKHINEDKILLSIKPEKDVDCFHPYNIGLLSIGKTHMLPCTPAGIIELIKRTGITISGKNCVVVGRSNIVGKPAAQLFLSENGTVTICHSKTANLSEICKTADILVSAIGKPCFIKKEMLKDGAVVIDVGINRVNPNDKKICGDVDFNDCLETASAITPVPGGVGVMTIAMLMKNCLAAYKEQHL